MVIPIKVKHVKKNYFLKIHAQVDNHNRKPEDDSSRCCGVPRRPLLITKKLTLPATKDCFLLTPESLPWNCLWLKRADSPEAMPLPGQLRTCQSGGVRAWPPPSFTSSLKGQSDSEIIPHPSSLPSQPCGITEASVFTASQLSFFLCPFLLPPLP